MPFKELGKNSISTPSLFNLSIPIFISCSTTSKSSSSGAYVGEETGGIGVVNNWNINS